ncbi:hypothetical protein FHS18_004743 [Paenibacillus phyllosphaerae]|uniref:Uncharacterized protein n=1 Tax=Paenibacillus phyllosphaerae TaxID=274593 RepID=A0A7W5B1F6_9BACL|nr:hypothetical protein [Paenibacillus phyllosphaerae]MBB3112642.1 hypothetical protein [Paenibacillus phyllosphaerae]
MITASILLGLSCLVGAVELTRLWTKKHKRTVAVYAAVLIMGNAMIVLRGLGIALPNPADWLTAALTPLNNMLLHLGLIES